MWENVGDEVTVPSVVGLPYSVAQAVASAAGVTLANPDPDGPPIGALAWEGDFFISRQSPARGAVVTRHSSLVVHITEERPGEDVAAHRNPSPSPSSHIDHAVPEVEQHVDLTERTDVRHSEQ